MAGETGTQMPKNPVSNIEPVPAMLKSGQCSKSAGVYRCANPCVGRDLKWPAYDDQRSCTTYLLSALNRAHRIDKVAPISLPRNWYSLSAPEQLFILANLERGVRGYPPYLGLNANLSDEAYRAARARKDPGLAVGFGVDLNADGSPGMGGAWSEGFNPLIGDYYWMYDDGWAGSGTTNLACTSVRAKGCWAHRDELLGADPGFNPGVGTGCSTCEMGAAMVGRGDNSVMVDLVERPAGNPPRMYFTWASELGQFAPGSAGVLKVGAGGTGATSTSLVPVTSTTGSGVGGWVVRASASRVSSTMVKVSWVTSPSTPVTQAKLWFYSGASCTTSISEHTSEYTAGQQINGASVEIDWAGQGLTGAYSANVMVAHAGVWKTSGCVSWVV